MNEMIRLCKKDTELTNRIKDGDEVSYIEFKNVEALKNLCIVRALENGELF